MTDAQFVLDSNVIVGAALLSGSISRKALQEARRSGEILLSAALVAELGDVLTRKRFDRYNRVETRLEFLGELVRTSLLLEPQIAIDVCRDPKDNMILELAVEGQVTCVITGDKDLLVLNPFRGLPIVSPRVFLDDVVPGLPGKSPGAAG